jgi:hypothetical protein
MIVNDFDDFHRVYLLPEVLSMLVFGYGPFLRGENQPVRLIELASPLTFAIASQLVIPPRQVADIFQALCRSQIIQAPLQQLAPALAIQTHERPFVIGCFPQLSVSEGNIHNKVRVYYLHLVLIFIKNAFEGQKVLDIHIGRGRGMPSLRHATRPDKLGSDRGWRQAGQAATP